MKVGKKIIEKEACAYWQDLPPASQPVEGLRQKYQRPQLVCVLLVNYNHYFFFIIGDDF